YRNWHLYIRDDGSNDKSLSIIKAMEKEYPNKITNLSHLSGGGNASKNFFTILKWLKVNKNYDFFMLSDQDDFWLPNKITKSLRAFNDQVGPILVHTDLRVVDQNLEIISNSYAKFNRLQIKDNTLSDLLVQNKITGCTMMWNRELNETIDYNCVSKALMHDWWIALVAASFGKIIYLDTPTVLYRQHNSNVVGAKKKTLYRYLMSLNNVQNSINRSIKQASSFYTIYHTRLSQPKAMLIRTYGDIKENSKVKRLLLIFKFKLVRANILERLGQILYI
ncbi:MAG: glycosyltransferase, partial [bacterium]|nr:glycosyltransferase [bacterium]